MKDQDNPYRPPATTTGFDESTELTGKIEIFAQFVFTADHYLESLRRYRCLRPERWLWTFVRVGCAILGASFAVLFLGFGIALGGALPIGLGVGLIPVSAFLFFSHKLVERGERQKFCNSPNCDRVVSLHFSSDAMYWLSETSQATIKWNEFSRAVFFRDGVLLFQGPNVVHWVPDDLFTHGEAFSLRQFISTKVDTRR